jgi:hypothetical protein
MTKTKPDRKDRKEAKLKLLQLLRKCKTLIENKRERERHTHTHTVSFDNMPRTLENLDTEKNGPNV